MAQLNIQEMVERRVLGFSSEMIVRLSYVLRAIIGLVTFAVGQRVER